MMADKTPWRYASKARIPGPRRTRARTFAGAVAVTVAAGCGIWRAPPDIRQAVNPETLAPEAPNRSWTPDQPAADLRAPRDAWRLPDRILPETGETQELSSLIDVALRDNPDTRTAWEGARAAAARYGRALKPYYPVINTQTAVSPNERILFQDSPSTLIIHQNSYIPQVSLTYTLIDFGRRSQASELARQRLLAANFAFNRKMQDIVFGVERAYYALDAAESMEEAAQRNLDLARTVVSASDKRFDLGLATKPEVLLGKQVEARAVYDLENAHVMVKDAQAGLALVLGLPANRPLAITRLSDQPIPPDLAEEVDRLIDTALEQRPDLAARVAELRAAEAAVAKAKADFLPTIGFTGTYGETIWDYTVGGSARVENAEPAYSTVFRFNWDLFTGFDRLNALREAEADTAASRSRLASQQLDTIAEVWRAYYDYRAAVRKLDYAQALLAASQEAYDANLKTYTAGLSTIVEFLTAERDLATARFVLIQSRADLLTGSARVAYSAGALPVGALR